MILNHWKQKNSLTMKKFWKHLIKLKKTSITGSLLKRYWKKKYKYWDHLPVHFPVWINHFKKSTNHILTSQNNSYSRSIYLILCMFNPGWILPIQESRFRNSVQVTLPITGNKCAQNLNWILPMRCSKKRYRINTNVRWCWINTRSSTLISLFWIHGQERWSTGSIAGWWMIGIMQNIQLKG